MIARVACVAVLSALLSVTSTSADEPLRVHPDNPRYFAGADGQALFLTGAHTWMVFQTQEGESFDFDDWLTQFRGWDHNFMRGWHWEDAYYSPLPYAMKDGKYDLERYNDEYYARLRKRIEAMGKHNITISVMLFQGWSAIDKGKYRSPNPWPRHPYNPANNIQGVDGKLEKSHELSDPRVTALQEAYVRHTIDTLNDLDNIIWEITNESHAESWEWQQHMVRVIKRHEATKPKQHLVWLTSGAPSFEALLRSPADVVSHGGDIFRRDPPASDGRKIVICDSDHQGPLRVTRLWVWKNFTRGNLPILMDCKFQPKISWWGGGGFQPQHVKWDQMRLALGATRRLSERIDLAAMAPQSGGTDPSSTGYCLFSSDNPMAKKPKPNGKEFVIYTLNKADGVSIKNLTVGKEYRYEWINTISGKVEEAGQFKADEDTRKLTSEQPGKDAALYVWR